jgi:hypothetical protein
MEVLRHSEEAPRVKVVCPFLWEVVLEGLGQSESGKYTGEFATFLQSSRLREELLIPDEYQVDMVQAIQTKAVEETMRTVMTSEVDLDALRARLSSRLLPIMELPPGTLAELVLVDLLTAERIWNPTLPSDEDALQRLSSTITALLEGTMRGRLLDTFRVQQNGRELLKDVAAKVSSALAVVPVVAKMKSFVDTLQSWSVSSDAPPLLGQVAEGGGVAPPLLGQVAEGGGVATDTGPGDTVSLVHLTRVSEMVVFMDGVDASQLEYLCSKEDWLLEVFRNRLAMACNDVAVDFLRKWCEACSAENIADGGLTRDELPDIAAELERLSPLRSHAPTWAAVQVASRWCSVLGSELLQLALGDGLAHASPDVAARLRSLLDVSAITAVAALSDTTSRLLNVVRLVGDRVDQLSEQETKPVREYLHTGDMACIVKHVRVCDALRFSGMGGWWSPVSNSANRALAIRCQATFAPLASYKRSRCCNACHVKSTAE